MTHSFHDSLVLEHLFGDGSPRVLFFQRSGGGGAAPSPYVAMGGRAGAEQWRKVVHACEVVVAQRCVGRGVAAALRMLRTGAGGSDES